MVYYSRIICKDNSAAEKAICKRDTILAALDEEMNNNNTAEGRVAIENAGGGCDVKRATGNKASPLTCAVVNVTQGTNVTHMTISNICMIDSIIPP